MHISISRCSALILATAFLTQALPFERPEQLMARDLITRFAPGSGVEGSGSGDSPPSSQPLFTNAVSLDQGTGAGQGQVQGQAQVLSSPGSSNFGATQGQDLPGSSNFSPTGGQAQGPPETSGAGANPSMSKAEKKAAAKAAKAAKKLMEKQAKAAKKEQEKKEKAAEKAAEQAKKAKEKQAKAAAKAAQEGNIAAH